MTVPTASPLAARVAALQPSATLAMFARVKRLQADGAQILDLTAGEPDFAPPPAASEAAQAAIRDGLGRYTPSAGLPALRAAVARQIRDELGITYADDEVLISPGAKIGINEALMALLEPGDEVQILTPFWTSYTEMARIAGGKPVLVPCGEDDFLPRVDRLEAARTERTKVLLMNTPCNPTGAVYPEALLRDISEWALEHGIWIVSDEIYASLTYGGAQHVSPFKACPAMREQGVWVGGASKSYAMTGWRIGFVAAPREVTAAIIKLQGQLASCPCSISQYAALAAVEHCRSDRDRMHDAFEKRCARVAAGLDAIDGLSCPEPRGAFYAFPRLDSLIGRTDPQTGRTIESGDDFAEVLLEADQVACIGGTPFGEPKAFRLSFATSEEVIGKALEGIATRVAALS